MTSTYIKMSCHIQLWVDGWERGMQCAYWATPGRTPLSHLFREGGNKKVVKKETWRTWSLSQFKINKNKEIWSK